MVNEHWVWHLIACLEDSVHKMTPNLGQERQSALLSNAEMMAKTTGLRLFIYERLDGALAYSGFYV
ncbi:hypothetical protein BP5796_03536 [Coleophoma crateriformis]|uniref:Uncharacterized protein n=1 Tax=Coleophoma crateriformis TaxID=565419 RepID=A0A3D8SNI3_9HELO|nr:hypothetical protein BP5796_03536 [Coleophoma crateriformis]